MSLPFHPAFGGPFMPGVPFVAYVFSSADVPKAVASGTPPPMMAVPPHLLQPPHMLPAPRILSQPLASALTPLSVRWDKMHIEAALMPLTASTPKRRLKRTERRNLLASVVSRVLDLLRATPDRQSLLLALIHIQSFWRLHLGGRPLSAAFFHALRAKDQRFYTARVETLLPADVREAIQLRVKQQKGSSFRRGSEFLVSRFEQEFPNSPLPSDAVASPTN